MMKKLVTHALHHQTPALSQVHCVSTSIIHNNTVYLSSIHPSNFFDSFSHTHQSNITSQTANVLSQVDDQLSEAGSSKDHILRAEVYLKDIKTDFHKMNEVWNSWQATNELSFPTRVVVETKLHTHTSSCPHLLAMTGEPPHSKISVVITAALPAGNL